GAEGTRSRREQLAADRNPDDRDHGENGDREDKTETPDQTPLTPTAASPGPVSRQDNPFVRPCPRDASCRFGESRFSGCGRSRHSRRATDPPHLTWCAAWPPRASTAGGQQCQKDRPCALHFGN